MTTDHDACARIFGQIAVAAGVPIMTVFRSDAAFLRKDDGSPVTEADLASERLILAALDEAFPDIPVISEEASASGIAQIVFDRFILVDPLDGTREFIRRRSEFAVNIGLIEGGVAVAGAVYAPALGTLWIGGNKAFVGSIAPGDSVEAASSWRSIETRRPPADPLVAVASRSHPDRETGEFLARLAIEDRVSAGSSLKFCLVAAGEADVYPRFGPTMEWDVAGGDAVLRAAGGEVRAGDGTPFRYGKEGYRSGPFVALGDPALAPTIFAA